MSEKMKQDQIMLNAIAEIMRDADCKFSTEMIDLVESLARPSSPAQEPVTTEPVRLILQRCRSEIERQKDKCRSDGDAKPFEDLLTEMDAVLAIPAPPQPGREEIAEHLYTKFCTDPSIEWQDAPEKLKDVWRRYAGEIAALSGENSK